MIKPVSSIIKLTFCDLSNMFWTNIIHKSKGISAVHVVFDRYFENSIKTQTREKRGDQLRSVKALDQLQIQQSTHKVSFMQSTLVNRLLICNQILNQFSCVSGGFGDKAV